MRASPRVDLERFRADLREGDVEEMAGTLLATFTQDCPARFLTLEQAVQRGDVKEVASAAHAFKSGAGTVRATYLAAALSEVEAAARTAKPDSIPALLEVVRVEYLAVLRELETSVQQ